MSSRKLRLDRRGLFSGHEAQRAIIDIGSNTVRCVVFGGSSRAPTVLLNEKVVAQLGAGLKDTGKLRKESTDLAMRGLRRYALLLTDMGVDEVEVVATAAVREASNGAAFLEEVRALGFEPRVLDGLEEARVSAQGVIGAFPGAHGAVADLGGGSLELVRIGPDGPQGGVTLPLGTLRLAELRGDKPAVLRKKAARLLKKSGGAEPVDGPLYLVGGTWRAMAVVAMEARGVPMSDPHGLHLDREEAEKLARRIARKNAEKLRQNPRISSMRSALLPDAAVLLQALLKQLQPSRVVFSSWGLREGLFYDRLDPVAKSRDPLLAGVAQFAELRGVPASLATRMAGWTVSALPDNPLGSERVRLAAISLALASMQIEPNLRLSVGLEWALHKRWIALSPRGRAMIGAAIYANRNTLNLPDELHAIAGDDSLQEAVGWGLAIRLCRRIGGRSNTALQASSLRVSDGKLRLVLDDTHADLFGVPNEKDLNLLAAHLGLEPHMSVVPVSPASG